MLLSHVVEREKKNCSEFLKLMIRRKLKAAAEKLQPFKLKINGLSLEIRSRSDNSQLKDFSVMIPSKDCGKTAVAAFLLHIFWLSWPPEEQRDE